jgi:hypothetical protein
MRCLWAPIGDKRVLFGGEIVALAAKIGAAPDEEVAMRSLDRWMKKGATALVLLAISGPVMASGGVAGAAAGQHWLPLTEARAAASLAVEMSAWQSVVKDQIAAFAAGDADKAFGYAGAAFHEDYPDAQTFFVATLAHGYMPILTSRSHSFGQFEQLGEGVVAQAVTFVEGNQDRYDAVYVLSKEKQGWRVLGVVLTKSDAVSV